MTVVLCTSYCCSIILEVNSPGSRASPVRFAARSRKSPDGRRAFSGSWRRKKGIGFQPEWPGSEPSPGTKRTTPTLIYTTTVPSLSLYLRFGMRALALRTPLRFRASSGFGYYGPATVGRHTTPLNTRLYNTTAANRPLSSSRIECRSSRATCRPSLPSRKQFYSSSSEAVSDDAKQSGSGSGQSRKTNNKAIKYGIVGGVLGVGAIVYSDDVQHLYRAAARTGRVVGALAVCINE